MDPFQTMITDGAILIVSLFLILASSELFTNGVEWLGQKLSLSEGVVGSVLAAVGTALPETLIPIVAVAGRAEQFHEIGIGAIAGAPFMLSTLTMCVCGMSVYIFALTGRRTRDLNINKTIISRDLTFFLIAYAIGLAATLATDWLAIRQCIAFLLLIIYLIYLKMTFAHEGESGEAPEHLYFNRLLRGGTGLFMVVLQVLCGLGGILWGANMFVDHLNSMAHLIAVPAIILALILSPIATELPEKCNSVLWIRKKKDTLALGNITGAMVFQSCFPVAFGIAFTRWHLGVATVLSGITALTSAVIFLLLLRSNSLKFHHMICGGIFYASVIGYLLYTHLTD
jgi:cation:H+ antiporter